MNIFSNSEVFENFRHMAMVEDDSFTSSWQSMKSRRAPLELQVSERLVRICVNALSTAPAALLVGPPGTGKTKLMHHIVDLINQGRGGPNFSTRPISTITITPEEEWGYADLVLGETVRNGSVVTVEGALLQAIRNDHWLLFDEINRADMDRIFGSLLTWLSGDRVKIGMWKDEVLSTPRPVYLSWSKTNTKSEVINNDPNFKEYIVGSEWRLIGTYNAVDALRVFRMGQALSRRFKHIPVPPIPPHSFERIINQTIPESPYSQLIATSVAQIYSTHCNVPSAQLGPGLFTDIPRYVEVGLENEGLGIPILRSNEIGETGSNTNSVFDEDQEISTDHLIPDQTSQEASELSSPVLPTFFRELLAEGYLISVGSLLARMSKSTVEGLKEELMASEVFSETDWIWIEENLSTIYP